MINVRALGPKIALQFALILLPLVALLLYETAAESQRAERMSRAFSAHEAAIDARDHYAHFMDGATDSVDTGALSRRAREALAAARLGVGRLLELSPDHAATQAELGGWLRTIDEVARIDASVESLSRVRVPISLSRKRFEELAQLHRLGLDASIAYAIKDAETTRRTVLVLSTLLALATVAFVVQFIRGLSRPLEHAVDVANRISRGDQLASIDVNDRHDLGNLLGSLRRMHGRLQLSQAQVADHRQGLEQKIGELAQSRLMLDQAQAAAKLGSWQWDCQAPAANWSAELFRILGLSEGRTSPTLRHFLRAVPVADRASLLEQFRAMLERVDEVDVEHRIVCSKDEPRVVAHRMVAIRDAQGRLTTLSGVMQDITDRRRAEEQMRRLALFDGLTGLANRQHFHEHLNQALGHSRRHGLGFATIFMDLDRFKRINDTLGHGVGDGLLREAAARLLGCVRSSDAVAALDADPSNAPLVARLGGDEFVVLLRDLASPGDAVSVAVRIIKAFSEPFRIDGHELAVTASLGIAMYPGDGESGETLIKHADAAMYAAKKIGRNTFQFYSSEMNLAAFEKLSLEAQLQHAVRNRQFLLHYQPKVDILTGAVVGVEALVRWQHAQHGLLPPSRFISLAEELGVIVELGETVLEMGCLQLAQWRDEGLPDVHLSINLASPSFRSPDLVPRIEALLARHGLRPSQLQIEATETMLLESAGATSSTLHDLKKIGIQLSIDDFGTGYSSLTYLRRFPVDELKIDQSFVAEMARNSDDAAIVAAIVSLGRNMNRRIVAEGVESIRQARMLRAMGCELMQGFLFSRPLEADEITDLLQRPLPYAWAAQQSLPDNAPMALLTV